VLLHLRRFGCFLLVWILFELEVMNSAGIIKWIRITIKRSEQRENISNGKDGRNGEVTYECIKKRNISCTLFTHVGFIWFGKLL